ncbi:MAG: T9SS type A sorting domain-containing protein [Candidatus Krumholzibacteria bacterium]|nr:T9SS type A sorting domain-containing protein [Candidatus Krumholzibacteria bacterium]
MIHRKSVLCVGMGILLLVAFVAISFSDALAWPLEKKVFKRVKFVLVAPAHGWEDTVRVWGPVDLGYEVPFPSPLYPPLLEIPGEQMGFDLEGPMGRRVSRNPAELSPFTAYIEPLPEFDPAWVESFFDVFVEVEIPDALPGQIMVNYDPIHLTENLYQFPPYYQKIGGELISPVILYDLGSGMDVGMITYWEEEILPWSEPEAHLMIETAYRSDVAVIDELGRVKLEGAMSDLSLPEPVPMTATFSFRPFGDPGPFMSFATDVTMEGPRLSTTGVIGEGDGFIEYFEPGSEPFEGQVVEFELELDAPPYGVWRDSVIVYLDGIPPIPGFVDIHRDSIPEFEVDSFFDITFKLDDELVAPGTAELLVLPLAFDWTRDLTPIDQGGLGTDFDSVSCAPTAAASCLKYFADNGHPKLDNPEGDEAKPNASGSDIAKELQKGMGTDSTGTSVAGVVAGIKSYLKGHGQSGWDVSSEDVDDTTDLAEMLREFESDSEDVMIILYDTTAAGDTIGHLVTMGSSHFSIDPVSQKIDFMDPSGGGSTADNNYEVGTNAEGQPTTSGYDLNGSGGSAWIGGYVKVSPPEGGSSSSSMGGSILRPDIAGRDLLKAAMRVPWIMMSSGPVTGNGMIDILPLDTSTLPAGPMLMEIVTVDDQGIQCRDIRLAWVFSDPTGDDDGGPPIKTMLNGSYPNPFNPSTTIKYSVAKDTEVTMVIYDVAGRRVRTLLSSEFREMGAYTEPWDGKNDNGKSLASGVYFCRFIAAGQIEARKLIMLR